jgi:prefoldin subunit 5
MTTKQPSRQELQNELQLIRAQQSALKRQVLDLGARTARFGKALLELSPQAPKTDSRFVR